MMMFVNHQRPEHRLVKVFVHPGQTSARLHQLGWQGCIRQASAEVAGQEALLGRRLATHTRDGEA